ncbi:MAG: adenosylcobinamide-GDP ribazoletransferase [Eubacteriaceae bacterium]|nr:adenosylcobinamide-GDP ribazoletransferase [Eubacteriaceae bacterium]
MKYITAFFMAWGNFITLPCPLKRWDSDLKNMMLAFLPSVGAVIGLIWMGLFWLTDKIYLPFAIKCLLLVFYIFAICGFMHLDGFMDCNDAILSRRPLEDRQRILKDSTVGAFAAVTLVFLMLAWYAASGVAFANTSVWNLLIIPVISRSVSGACVLSYKPIGHSQYVKDYQQPDRGKYILIILLQVIVILGVCLIFTPDRITSVLIAVVMAAAGYLSCMYARKQLGGMSGDVAGYVICLSELSGILAMALVQYYVVMFG